MITLIIAGGFVVGSGVAQNMLQKKGKFEEAEILHTVTTLSLMLAGVSLGWYMLVVNNPLGFWL